MFCGIDIDSKIKDLQNQLSGAKDKALSMVTGLIDDAKAEAEAMKGEIEGSIRGWLKELEDLVPEIKIPLSVELMALASKLKGYADRLKDPKLTASEKAAINKEIADARKAFEDEWGPAMEKAGAKLDAILDIINGGGSFDPCALIPNLQKGVDGVIKELPNMPKLPIEEGIAELESVISETADKAKGAFKEYNTELNGAVKSIATAVKDAADDATVKLARQGFTPSGNRAPSKEPVPPIDYGFTLDELRQLYPRPVDMDVSEYEREIFSGYRRKKAISDAMYKEALATYESQLALWKRKQALLS
jgi:ElaB/YqjD/DUF883 family membrane-anchored ribosome-binding protein